MNTTSRLSANATSSDQLRTSSSTEETFAIDAGRDLFFPGMDADTAIQILDAPLGSLEARDDRFIAAERLKFYPSEKAVDAIIAFVRRFERGGMELYVLEDKVARRKAVESLGRHKGAFRREEVICLLRECLGDADGFMVEVAVWALAEIGVTNDAEVLEDIVKVLDSKAVVKRVVIQTLMRAKYTPALPRIRGLVEDADAATRSAAMTAVAILSGDETIMDPVVNILKSAELNLRRAAIEDITLSKHTPALEQVAVCPNSLVLRSRTVRVLLDKMKKENVEMEQWLSDDTAALVDRLIWDHPCDLDLLGQKKETKKARDASRNIRQLYKNDALSAYAASRCLAEDHRNTDSSDVATAVKKSHEDLGYFDYFGAYHVFKTLGWLRYQDAYELLVDNAKNLPPRFFNHQAGAATALAELGRVEAVEVLGEVAKRTGIWELKYACLIACERLGDGGMLRDWLKEDVDWLVRARARSGLGFRHLRSEFF